MKLNMGTLDRIIRTAAALALIGVYFAGLVEGTTAYILLGVSVVLLGTSAVGFCPAYLPIKLSTRKAE